jgi:hypothetical protein
VQTCAVGERIVAADWDERLNAEVFQHLQNVWCAVGELLFACIREHALEELGHSRLFDFGGVGARGVQVGAAVAVDRAHTGFGERLDRLVYAVVIVGVVVEQPAPAVADADHLHPGIDRAVHDRLDTRVQAGHVAAARQDSNSHSWSSL